MRSFARWGPLPVLLGCLMALDATAPPAMDAPSSLVPGQLSEAEHAHHVPSHRRKHRGHHHRASKAKPMWYSHLSKKRASRVRRTRSLEEMRQELHMLRMQLDCDVPDANCTRTGEVGKDVDWEKKVDAMKKQLADLEDMLRAQENAEAKQKKYTITVSHDELQAEIDRLQEAVRRIQGEEADRDLVYRVPREEEKEEATTTEVPSTTTKESDGGSGWSWWPFGGSEEKKETEKPAEEKKEAEKPAEEKKETEKPAEEAGGGEGGAQDPATDEAEKGAGGETGANDAAAGEAGGSDSGSGAPAGGEAGGEDAAGGAGAAGGSADPAGAPPPPAGSGGGEAGSGGGDASGPGAVAPGIDVDSAMPYGDLEPFGREDTAQELTEDSIRQSDEMVDQLERAEVAEEKRAVFRALTRLRGAAITSFDGVARSQTGNIDEYARTHQWREGHPVHHLAEEEADVSKWAFPDNTD